jgi:copper chaperone CopZ
MTKRLRKAFFLIIGLAALTGSLSAQTASPTQATEEGLKTATVKIGGITCEKDLPIIKKKLVDQEGVEEVNWSDIKGGMVTFQVRYHSAAAGEEEIKAAIEAAPSCDRPDVFPYRVKQIKSIPGPLK